MAAGRKKGQRTKHRNETPEQKTARLLRENRERVRLFRLKKRGKRE